MSSVYNVKDHGAVSDGQTLVTSAVQHTIDLCAAAGGGTVYFPAGEYVLATVYMRSGVTVEIDEGATLLGPLDFYAYAPHEKIDYPLYQDASHSYFETSMFVAYDCENVAIKGKGTIDMRSVWDADNVRNMAHRGAKPIAFKNCKNVEFSGFTVLNATDLAVYFAGCENVDVYDLRMRVYIDGISPDNCKNVRIHDCDIEAGDDGIVPKSSYTLNRLDVCKDLYIWNCTIKSRCNALKFGTESNGGFINCHAENIKIFDTRISGIAIESVDGALIENMTIKNVEMVNVNAPIFIHIGRRMRGPKFLELGQIRNITLENITAKGPYKPYDIMPWNYECFLANDTCQYPWYYHGVAGKVEDPDPENKAGVDWQMTSNVCGLRERPLQNITLRNVHLELDGGVREYALEVPEKVPPYPEVYVYGKILPAKGIYFRFAEGLTLDNVTVKTNRPDAREDFVFAHVTDLKKG